MSRVSQKIINRLCEFLDSLPTEARNKCTLCNQTLSHLVRQAEAETGAPESTIYRVIAEKHNETALPNDRVTANALRQRGKQYEGDKKRSDGTLKDRAKALMVRELIADCSATCADPASCAERWMHMSFDEILKAYDIVTTFAEVMAETGRKPEAWA